MSDSHAKPRRRRVNKQDHNLKKMIWWRLYYLVWTYSGDQDFLRRVADSSRAFALNAYATVFFISAICSFVAVTVNHFFRTPVEDRHLLFALSLVGVISVAVMLAFVITSLLWQWIARHQGGSGAYRGLAYLQSIYYTLYIPLLFLLVIVLPSFIGGTVVAGAVMSIAVGYFTVGVIHDLEGTSLRKAVITYSVIVSVLACLAQIGLISAVLGLARGGG